MLIPWRVSPLDSHETNRVAGPTKATGLSMATLAARHVLRCPKDVQLMMRRKVPRRLKDPWETNLGTSGD